MKITHFLLIGAALLLAAPMFLAPGLIPDATTPTCAAASVFLAAPAAWSIAHELIGLRQTAVIDLSPLKRFAAPQTGTPPATAFG